MKVRLRDICDIVKGKTTITKAIEGEYPLVVTGENRLSNNEYQFDCSAVCVPLVSATGHGHASIKRIHYQEGKFALGSILAAVIPKSIKEVNPRYLHIYLSYFKDSVIVPLMRGSANVSLTIKSLGSAEIDLPSIEKQLEIVRLISEVEKMKDEMDRYLIEQENVIVNMKKEILQLAVQGKLVPQNPNDEAAEVLLEKIREEKERLIKEKKIKKEKALSDISEEEKYFELPSGWEYTRLGNIGDWGAGATPSRSNSEFYGGNINWIKTGELNDSYINGSEEKITELALEKCSLRINKPGDILIAMYGATIGKLGMLNCEATTNQACCGCTPYSGILNKYLFTLLLAMRSEFKSQGAGGAQPNISRQKIVNTVVIIPPLEEQKRIVKKVDSLMILCDELENKIEEQRNYSNRLMESILKSSLSR